jgi:hypothetical protein
MPRASQNLFLFCNYYKPDKLRTAAELWMVLQQSTSGGKPMGKPGACRRVWFSQCLACFALAAVASTAVARSRPACGHLGLDPYAKKHWTRHLVAGTKLSSPLKKIRRESCPSTIYWSGWNETSKKKKPSSQEPHRRRGQQHDVPTRHVVINLRPWQSRKPKFIFRINFFSLKLQKKGCIALYNRETIKTIANSTGRVEKKRHKDPHLTPLPLKGIKVVLKLKLKHG